MHMLNAQPRQRQLPNLNVEEAHQRTANCRLQVSGGAEIVQFY
jgi:hypothetical protein